MLDIHVVSLFPDMFTPLIEHGVIGRAASTGKLTLHTWNPRDYALDKHRTVDDRPYGGGPGMVMQVQPLRDAILAAKAAAPQAKVIYLSPQGQRFTQATAIEMSDLTEIILVAGRYEGIDERLIKQYVDEEWSIGDYVLSGGELPAMVLIDAVARLLPEVLGHNESAQQDSFMDGLLDCPHYTRPEVFEDESVPDVLLSGDHKAIAAWRLQQALGRTWERRPDLLEKRDLNSTEQTLLSAYQALHDKDK